MTSGSWLLLLLLVLAALFAAACDAPPAGGVKQPVQLISGSVRVTSDFGDQAPFGAVHLARGEREGIQALIDPEASGKLKVRIDGEAHGLSLVVYDEPVIEITKASPGGATGSYHDPLLRLASAAVQLKEGRRAGRVLWIDVHAASDAPAGMRHIEVLIDDRRVASARVRVHDVTLPPRSSLASSIGVDESQVRRFEHVESGTKEWSAALDGYYDALLEARLSPADLYFKLRIRPADSNASADSTDDERVARIIDHPNNASVRIPFYQTFPFADPLGADRAAALAYLRTAAAHFASMGWLERSYVYVYDEPHETDAPRLRAMADLVHEADPRLRLLLTAAPRPAFRGAADIWVVNIGPAFRPGDVARLREQRAGREYWWYPSITTTAPYPTLFIDDPRPSPRAYGWLAYRYGIDGFLYWSATHWHDVKDPWKNAATYLDPDGAVGNGDGSLLYPAATHGLDSPAPSVRLLQLRDGIEDHDLLTMLAKRPGGGRRAETIATALADTPTSFEVAPREIAHWHRKLLLELEN